jgi:mutator protein MutT
MVNRKIAVVLFFDKDLNILVQDRTSHSKVGEKYGFFGGGIEDGETPEQALNRELTEELGFVPEKIIYWGEYSFDFQAQNFTGELFLSPITDKLLNCRVYEGDGKVILPLDDLLSNRDKLFGDVIFHNIEKLKTDIFKYIGDTKPLT